MLSTFGIDNLKEEILDFLYKTGTLSYDDICFHLRPRIISQPSRYYSEHISKRRLQEYRAKTMEQSKDVANHILDELLQEGAIKGNRSGYSITEIGKPCQEFRKNGDRWFEEIYMQIAGDYPTREEDDYDGDMDDARDWEEDKENHELMARLFDIEA